MQADGSDRTLSRLEELERRLREAVVRLEAVEGRPSGTTLPPPPPVTRPYEPPPPRQPSPPPKFQVAPIPEPPRSSNDTEFSVGAKILPRVGAFLVLLGIGYLIGLGVTHGWITPAMQFIGAVFLCLAFVAVGIYKLNEQHEFGHLLVGIGSCGLYITFAGGHLYQHLYSDYTLIALFLALSLANLAFCWWRSAQSFLAIGIVGGVSAVMMPIDSNPGMVIPLHFLVLIPAVVVIAKNRWHHWTLMMWLITLIPPIAYIAMRSSDWLTAISFLYASSALQIAVGSLTYPSPHSGPGGRVYDIRDFDPQGIAPSVMAVFTMLAAFAVKFNPGHLLVFTVVILAWAFLLPSSNPQRLKLASAVTIACLILAPATLTPERASVWYSLEAVACAIASLRPNLKFGAGVAYVLWSCGLYAYVMSFVSERHAELGVVGLAMLSGIVVTAALRKAQYLPTEFTIISSLIGLALTSRVSQLLLGSDTWTLTLAWSLYASALLAVGFSIREQALRYLGLSVFGLAAMKVLMVDIVEVPQSYRVLVLLVLGLAMLGCGYWYIRVRKP